VPAKRRSAAEWTRIIARFRRSGLTQREFCEREEVSLSALQNWLYRRSKSSTAANFVEVAQVNRAELISNRTATIRLAEVEVVVGVEDVAGVAVDLVAALAERGASK
jgi:transcriptional regulator with XRE-family HTH domain